MFIKETPNKYLFLHRETLSFRGGANIPRINNTPTGKLLVFYSYKDLNQLILF